MKTTEWRTKDGKLVRAWGTGLYAEVAGEVIDITPEDDNIFEWNGDYIEPTYPRWKVRIIMRIAKLLGLAIELRQPRQLAEFDVNDRLD